MLKRRSPIQNLYIKSAGAAQGLITALSGAFRSHHAIELHCEYEAAGAAYDSTLVAALAGHPPGLVVLTPPLLDRLSQTLRTGVRRVGSLGTVVTGLVARSDGGPYNISTVDALRSSLSELDLLLVPDLEKSTGGRHLAHVLQSLGMNRVGGPPMQEYAGGAEAVAALLQIGAGRRVLACAQRTELLDLPNVTFVGEFPATLHLSTEYVLGVIEGEEAFMAERFAGLLTDSTNAGLRRKCGFEPA